MLSHLRHRLAPLRREAILAAVVAQQAHRSALRQSHLHRRLVQMEAPALEPMALHLILAIQESFHRRRLSLEPVVAAVTLEAEWALPEELSSLTASFLLRPQLEGARVRLGQAPVVKALDSVLPRMSARDSRRPRMVAVEPTQAQSFPPSPVPRLAYPLAVALDRSPCLHLVETNPAWEALAAALALAATTVPAAL